MENQVLTKWRRFLVQSEGVTIREQAYVETQMWEHDSYSGIYNGVFFNGAPLGLESASQTTHPSGTAYGGGLQFHFEQLAVRAQYERISGERSFGGWNNPDLMSVGLSWTF